MVRIEVENGSRQSIEVDGGGTGRSIMLRVKESLAHDATITRASISLSPSESEALENALRIQRRNAERRAK
jgi:hypothetical protein